jgi:predicted nucleic acid-binding protein
LYKTSKVNPYDCAHAAIMKRVGIKNIISTDPHYEISGILRLDPLNYS